MADQWVYDFAEGSKEMRDLLGGKGANVAEMTRVLGADRVPAGFTITTEACVAYMKAGQAEPDGMAEQVAEALERLQEHTGKQLGDDEDPLLVSVRSGRSEEHTSELQSPVVSSYAVFCLKKKKKTNKETHTENTKEHHQKKQN